ncbi:hypothetical protein SAMN05216428_10579 [Nitrosospira sp. Nsp11]|uniref:hypothetical protein n=1 Tax=Nitrosospira sp. Nsp11 TaxID=1855338 RepID=UPI00091762FF|nr:hypothetical protein [Nitrosospira sp. Nsp11]SHL70807.1 hypothetical protein SAMN05216428_10579 [Nitrosospira sp. Nsp11]
MEQTTLQSLFLPGQVVATSGALDKVEPVWMANCLARHMKGDWGVVCEEDAKNNNAGAHALRIRERCNPFLTTPYDSLPHLTALFSIFDCLDHATASIVI